jgi:hypothetical protein
MRIRSRCHPVNGVPSPPSLLGVTGRKATMGAFSVVLVIWAAINLAVAMWAFCVAVGHQRLDGRRWTREVSEMLGRAEEYANEHPLPSGTPPAPTAG